MNEKRLFIVAGEASGDTHAARLISSIKASRPEWLIEGLGGEKMRQAGCELRTDLVSSAVMGYLQVMKKLPFFRRLLAETVEHIRKSRPDAIILVDYPGFNLRLAAAVKKLGIKIIYYISPQVWAWRPGRIYKITRLVDKMIVILPFEEDLYKNINVDVTYVGHPILDSISEAELDNYFLEQIKPEGSSSAIGLLPGSRKQEIRTNLPVMIETAKILLRRMPRAGFLIPCSNRDNMKFVQEAVEGEPLPVKVFLGRLHEVAKASHCCIVASGTATLEVACFLTPLVVVYKTGHLAWLIGRTILKVPHISLVNILAGEEIVPEMLQYRMRPELLSDTVMELCTDGERRRKMISDLDRICRLLGKPGASLRAADAICKVVDPDGSVSISAAS